MIPILFGFYQSLKKICYTTFDGINEKIQVSNGTALAFERTDSFSISAWVMTPDVVTSGYIFAKEHTTGQGYTFSKSSTKLYFLLRKSGTNRLIVSTPTNSLIVNTWQYVTVTYNGNSNASGCNIYIDGVLQTLTIVSNALSASIVSNLAPALIGARSLGDFYDGYIDEVSIWDKELTSGEETTKYNKGRKNVDYSDMTNYANCVSHWHFGENYTWDGSVLTLPDVKSLNDGTSSGMDESNIICG